MRNYYLNFLEKNKEKVKRITDNNTKRNENGFPVISQDDPWRKETGWDANIE